MKRELELRAELERVIVGAQAQTEAATARAGDLESLLEQSKQHEVDLDTQLADVRTAWEALVRENDELRARRLETEAALAASAAGQRGLERELSEARAQALRASADPGVAPSVTELVVHLADELANAGSLKAESGLRSVDAMIAAAGEDPRLLLRRGMLLAELGHDQEALETLGPLADQLPRDGLSVLARVSLRSGVVPAADVLDAVTWSQPEEFTFLGGCAARLPIDRALDLAAHVVGTLAPAQVEELLGLQLGRPGLKDAQVQRLIDIWTEASPAKAAEQLLTLLDQRPVSDRSWMEDRLRSVALRHGRPLDAARGLVRLAERNRDPAAILAVRSDVKGRLDGKSKLALDGEIALAVTRVTSEPAYLDDAALIAVELPRQWRLHAAPEEAEAIEQLLRELLPSLSSEARDLVEAAGITPEPEQPTAVPDVVHVTDLADALGAAAARHPDLVVLKDAWESARRSGRGNNRKAARILEGIGKVATDWKLGRVDPWVALRRLPCEFKGGVSEQAVHDYPSDYRRRDGDGAEVLLGPHFVVGNKANLCRIYLSIDQEHRRIIVGHVGEKLRDSTNP